MARKLFSISILIIVVNIVSYSPCAFSQQYGSYGPEGGADWIVINSAYAQIFVDKNINLSDAAERLDIEFAKYDPIERKLFLGKGVSDEEKLANKIDIIVRKAKKILDMHPEDYSICIRIYETDEAMWSVYEEIFKERKEYKAFYINKFQTIYISLNGLSESVLAHELGHSIIDAYFKILPPEKIRELLACYVDVHLKD